MIEGMNPQAANLARDSGAQQLQSRGAQESANQGPQARENSVGNTNARPAQDVSVQISQQGLDSAAANSGEAVPDAAATDTNTASTLSSGDFGSAASETGNSASSRAEATNSPGGGAVAGNQSVSADEQLGTNIDVEA
ncbi:MULTISPECIES: hypothetical protein [Gammaproteobacteria]|jgi:hypothetical protein|uniref:Uncharacterized protein n=1 Tax=Vreelandella halophila TaxID=86177 RepID=A0A9X4YB02_9GAMM|nr:MULTISPECIES: hypothetical protein [Gammaproteobacteria]KAA8982882.1 hypothetical protein F3089_07090 [Halospina sp. K52047b]MYL25950.1 hypothetical protein [Halomonas utahensis]MYL73488.1 hypothetical protein [Halomonas sp. 22501_18_FS]